MDSTAEPTQDQLQAERQTVKGIARDGGLGELARVLTLHPSAKGDYPAERHQWLDSIALEEFERNMAAMASPITPPR